MKVSALSRTSLGTTACTRGSAPFRSSGKKCCHRRPRLAANLCGWNSVRPSHLFGHYFDHDYYFELPCGSGAPSQFDGDLRPTMRGLPQPSRTRVFGHRTARRFLPSHQKDFHGEKLLPMSRGAWGSSSTPIVDVLQKAWLVPVTT